MKRIFDPDYVYRPWSEKRRREASRRAKERIASRPNESKIADCKRKIQTRVGLLARARARVRQIEDEITELDAELRRLWGR